jgi:hypothetical protein
MKESNPGAAAPQHERAATRNVVTAPGRIGVADEPAPIGRSIPRRSDPCQGEEQSFAFSAVTVDLNENSAAGDGAFMHGRRRCELNPGDAKLKTFAGFYWKR